MHHKFLSIVAFFAVLPVSAACFAQAGDAKSDPAATAIVKAFEDRLNLEGLDVTNTFNLVQKKEGETDRVLQVKVFRRDSADTFTLIFQYPESEKGKGYYRKGDDLFLYLPSTREFAYRNRKDDVGGSDIRTDMFGKSNLEDQYRLSLAGRATVSKWDCDVVRLEARQLDVSFPIQKWFVRKTDGLPVKVENYSASETLLRTIYYIDYRKLSGDRFIFTKLLAVDALEKGQKTLLTNDGIETGAIPNYVFTKAYLEEQSR
jgi:outer membrane lipoprotein-sorting protein